MHFALKARKLERCTSPLKITKILSRDTFWCVFTKSSEHFKFVRICKFIYTGQNRFHHGGMAIKMADIISYSIKASKYMNRTPRTLESNGYWMASSHVV